MDRFEKQFYKELSFLAGGLVLTLAIICGALTLASQQVCYAKWDDAEVQSRWSFSGGCQIRMQDGRWIPEERYVNMKEIK